ncbi:MAG: arginine--tRNA ligase, partial [Clostridia bacterium]|nr:arginine--tRNA ligase [Clostridia bacterium]
KFEPCFVSRILIDISKAFNKYYSNNRVVEDNKTNKTRLALVMATKIILASGLKLLGIDALEKM